MKTRGRSRTCWLTERKEPLGHRATSGRNPPAGIGKTQDLNSMDPSLLYTKSSGVGGDYRPLQIQQCREPARTPLPRGGQMPYFKNISHCKRVICLVNVYCLENRAQIVWASCIFNRDRIRISRQRREVLSPCAAVCGVRARFDVPRALREVYVFKLNWSFVPFQLRPRRL